MDIQTDVKPQWEDLALRPEKRLAADQAPQRRDLPASYLTHELRAPVTAIRLGLELLQEQIEGRLQTKEKHILAVAVRNTARLEGLVNDIMDYSKIMARRLTVAKTPCDPRDLINEAADSMRAIAIAQSVKLEIEAGEPLPRVTAEGRRIVQVLTNLICNAIKFTPARGRVTVSAKKGRHEHEGTILFRVKDTGCGIPAQDIEKIFDMFVQSTPTLKQTEGTGLGLTLARLMVELHGGRIWADSWRGVGASFYFTIPITPEDMGRKIEVYPKEVQYSGLLVGLARRFNSFLALFV